MKKSVSVHGSWLIVHFRLLSFMFWVFFCATGLSRDLEELMVEGLLLQVSLPEVQSLYHVLLDRASSQHTNRCMSPPQDESTDCDTHMQFNSQGKNLPLNQVPTLNSELVALLQTASMTVLISIVSVFRMTSAG